MYLVLIIKRRAPATLLIIKRQSDRKDGGAQGNCKKINVAYAVDHQYYYYTNDYKALTTLYSAQLVKLPMQRVKPQVVQSHIYS